MSERHACRLVDLNRGIKQSIDRWNPIHDYTDEVIELSEKRDRWGYRAIYDGLQLNGVKVGHERVRLIREVVGLQVRKKQHKRRYPGRTGSLRKAEYSNHVWNYDFVTDRTEEGKKLKILTVIDEYSKRALLVESRHATNASTSC